MKKSLYSLSVQALFVFFLFQKISHPPEKDTPRRGWLDPAGPQSGDAVAPGRKGEAEIGRAHV